MTWSADLWELMRPSYDAVLEHPFLVQLADGTLPDATFDGYLVQDAHYLGAYARALALVGGRAQSWGDTTILARHAAATADVELALHAQLLDETGLDAATLPEPSPTTYAYTSHLLALAQGGSYAEGVAAVLPCYWIYARVGAHLASGGSVRHRYQRWIDMYAGEEFAMVVTEVLALTDRVGRGLGAEERERAGRAAATSARYEWMFWDAAHRGERWPL